MTTARLAEVPRPEFGLPTDECWPASDRCGYGLSGVAVPVAVAAVDTTRYVGEAVASRAFAQRNVPLIT